MIFHAKHPISAEIYPRNHRSPKEAGAFSNRHSLSRVDFGGTMSQWIALREASGDSVLNSPYLTVSCTDGVLGERP